MEGEEMCQSEGGTQFPAGVWALLLRQQSLNPSCPLSPGVHAVLG